jgi:hypothetical protein
MCCCLLALSIASRVAAGAAPAAATRPRLPRGYLIVQQVAAYNTTRYGAISTAEEADRLFGALQGRVDGVEFEPLFYQQHDLRAARVVAESAQRHGIEVWSSTFRLLDRIRALGPIPPEFQAHVMQPDGTIVPATHEERPLFDVLNPEAVDWFLARYRETYIQPFRGLLHGLIFNEDVLPYLDSSRKWNNTRFHYWGNATFSPRVLAPPAPGAP